MDFFDTHAHYDDPAFDPDRDALLAELPARGVSLVLCPAQNLESAEACAALAARHAHVYAAAGFHPHDASRFQAGDLERLGALAAQPKVVAIGELGLDYHYDHSPRETQRAVLRAQLSLARELNLPVIFHDREAHADTMELLREFPGLTGVLHCYSGGVEQARALVDMGWMLSFTGAVTFPNARRAHEVLRALPLDRLLLETDAPYMAPVPFRGRRCDSSLLHLTASCIAGLLGLSAEALAARTAENGRRLFGIEQTASAAGDAL